jgi:hypothetical protein
MTAEQIYRALGKLIHENNYLVLYLDKFNTPRLEHTRKDGWAYDEYTELEETEDFIEFVEDLQ